MIEQRLPIQPRWNLFALGAVRGKRLLRPKDPVAAWVLRNHPSLVPSLSAPDLYTTIRARTEVIDRMILEHAAAARARGETLALWTVGGGFDARWARQYPDLSDVVGEFGEVETPSVLELKEEIMPRSPYSGRWAPVARVKADPDEWSVRSPRHRALVSLEGLVDRLGEEGVRGLLMRLRRDVPAATVLLDLTGVLGEARQEWSGRRLEALGWRVTEDLDIRPRQRLVTMAGTEICAGMRPFRVVALVACEPAQDGSPPA